MTNTTWPYDLQRHKLYRIPSTSVSYHPLLANRRVFWTGNMRELPANGGTMAEFRLCDGQWNSSELILLRPFAVVEA